MSREIKFRAWNPIEKEYWDGCGRPIAVGGGKVVDGADWQGWGFNQVCDYIVEQYTGLKDKNGKEIYEGDIVKVYSKRKLLDGFYQVIWNEEEGGFECECLKPMIEDYDNIKDVRVFNEYSAKFKVIGNIHENPELLEGENV